jgi:hypothetical protein
VTVGVAKSTLNSEAWHGYLRSHMKRERRSYIINGTLIQDRDSQRILYGWLEEGRGTTLWMADTFLINVGLTVDDYFLYCKEKGLWPWRREEAPEWEI